MALTFNTTTRRALRWLTGTNLVSDIDAGFQALAEDVDAQLLTRSFGKSVVVTTETRSNAAYGLMPTPDRVQNIVLPTDGLIAVLCQATWQESVVAAANAAIFLGANQTKAFDATVGGAPSSLGAAHGAGVANTDKPLMTWPGGLIGSSVGNQNTAYAGDVTTGQVVGQFTNLGSTSPFNIVGTGGPCYIFAAAGTYDVSVQFKASSGSVTVKNRKLWVWSIGF